MEPHEYDPQQWQKDKLGQTELPESKESYTRAEVQNLVEHWGYAPEELRFDRDGNLIMPSSSDMTVHLSNKRAAAIAAWCRQTHTAPSRGGGRGARRSCNAKK